MLTVDFERLGLVPGERVLDLGCGGGRHAFECARRGARVIALDSDPVELKEASAVLSAMEEAGEVPAGIASSLRASALALPLADESVDAVIAAEVLEHVPDDRRAIGELARVLRRGGRLAVTVPRHGPEVVCWLLSSEYHERPGGHVRVYRRRELAGRLVEHGLSVVGARHVHGLHSPYWWLRCLVGVEAEAQPLVAAYHRVLVHDIVHRSAATRVPDALLSPLIGKSLVLYAVKR